MTDTIKHFIVYDNTTGEVVSRGSCMCGKDDCPSHMTSVRGNTSAMEFGDNTYPVELRDVPVQKLVVVDGVVKLNPDPKAAKVEQYQTIDAKTSQLISQGFTYRDVVFSLSVEAQMKMLGADALRAELSFPLTWNNIDDTAQVAFQSADELHQFVLAGLRVVRAALDSGTDLKGQVRRARTIGGVQGVKDAR